MLFLERIFFYQNPSALCTAQVVPVDLLYLDFHSGNAESNDTKVVVYKYMAGSKVMNLIFFKEIPYDGIFKRIAAPINENALIFEDFSACFPL